MLDQETKERLQDRYYPELEDKVFGPLHEILSSPRFDNASVLDAGCGPGSWILEQYKDRYKHLVGLDLYKADNTMADSFVLGTLEWMPFAAATFDLVLCYVVLEHVQEPTHVFAEFSRVLKPGGTLIFKTPAAYAPTSLLTRLLPYRAHCTLKGLIGIEETEIFPTYFRCNTLQALKRLLRRNHLVPEQLLKIDQTYAYLSFNPLTYRLGLLYSRGIQRPGFDWLRNGIVGVCVKEARS
jgi:SAM-dependent methyltransferase